MTVTIRDADFDVVSKSKNLRGILDYCRSRSAVERLDLYGPDKECGGQLGIAWFNGSTCITDFASYAVMEQWVAKRACLKGAQIKRHATKSIKAPT